MINQDLNAQLAPTSPTRVESTVSDEEKRMMEWFVEELQSRARKELSNEGTKRGKNEGGDNEHHSALNGTETNPRKRDGLRVDEEQIEGLRQDHTKYRS